MVVREVRVSGPFDASAAAWVVSEIERAKDGRVLVDLRGARDLHATAIARLARSLGPRVSVIGLSRHHEQLMRYLRSARTRVSLPANAP